MPVQLRLTSVMGDVVEDTLPDWTGGPVSLFILIYLPFCPQKKSSTQICHNQGSGSGVAGKTLPRPVWP